MPLFGTSPLNASVPVPVQTTTPSTTSTENGSSAANTQSHVHVTEKEAVACEQDLVISPKELMSVVMKSVNSIERYSPPITDESDKQLFELLVDGKCSACHSKHSFSDKADWNKHVQTATHKRKKQVLDFLNEFAAGIAFEPSEKQSVLQKELTEADEFFWGQELVHELHDLSGYSCWLCSLCNVAQSNTQSLITHLQSNTHKINFLCEQRPELAAKYGHLPFSEAILQISVLLVSDSNEQQIEVLQFDPNCAAAERDRCVVALKQLLQPTPSVSAKSNAVIVTENVPNAPTATPKPTATAAPKPSVSASLSLIAPAVTKLTVTEATTSPAKGSLVAVSETEADDEIVMLSEKIVKKHVKNVPKSEPTVSSNSSKAKSSPVKKAATHKPTSKDKDKTDKDKTSSATTTVSSNGQAKQPISSECIQRSLVKEKGVNVYQVTCVNVNTGEQRAICCCETCRLLFVVNNVKRENDVLLGWKEHKATEEHKKCVHFREANPIDATHILPDVEMPFTFKPATKSELSAVRKVQATSVMRSSGKQLYAVNGKAVGSLQVSDAPMEFGNVVGTQYIYARVMVSGWAKEFGNVVGTQYIYARVMYTRGDKVIDYFCDLCCVRLARVSDVTSHCQWFEHALRLMHADFKSDYTKWLLPQNAKEGLDRKRAAASCANKQSSAVINILKVQASDKIQGPIKVLDAARANMINGGCMTGSRYDTSVMKNAQARYHFLEDMLMSDVSDLLPEERALPMLAQVHTQIRVSNVPLLGVQLVMLVTSTNTQWNTFLCRVCPSWQADDSLLTHLHSTQHNMAYFKRDHPSIAQTVASFTNLSSKEAAIQQHACKIANQMMRANPNGSHMLITRKLTERIDINQAAKIWPNMVKQFMQLLSKKQIQNGQSPQKQRIDMQQPHAHHSFGGDPTAAPMSLMQGFPSYPAGQSLPTRHNMMWPAPSPAQPIRNPAADPQEWDAITQQFLTKLAQPPVPGVQGQGVHGMDIGSTDNHSRSNATNTSSSKKDKEKSTTRDRDTDTDRNRRRGSRRSGSRSRRSRSRDHGRRRRSASRDRHGHKRTVSRSRSPSRHRDTQRHSQTKKSRTTTSTGTEGLPSALRRAAPAPVPAPTMSTTSQVPMNSGQPTVSPGAADSEQVLSQLLADLRSGKAPDEVAVLQVLLEERRRQEQEDQRQQQLRLLLTQLQQQQKPTESPSSSTGAGSGLQQAVMRVFGAGASAGGTIAPTPLTMPAMQTLTTPSDDLVKDAALNILRTQQHMQHLPAPARMGPIAPVSAQSLHQNQVAHDWSRYAAGTGPNQTPTTQGLSGLAHTQNMPIQASVHSYMGAGASAGRQPQSVSATATSNNEQHFVQLQSSLEQMTDEQLYEIALAEGGGALDVLSGNQPLATNTSGAQAHSYRQPNAPQYQRPWQ